MGYSEAYRGRKRLHNSHFDGRRYETLRPYLFAWDLQANAPPITPQTHILHVDRHRA